MVDLYAFLRIILIIAVIGGVIALLVILLMKSKNKNAPDVPAMERQTETSTPSYTATSAGTSIIFVNGGAPSSGSKMGTLTVDGKSLSLFYIDAPIEITIPAGSHHIVVEGGTSGDARIDRVIELGILDVWTIDMPGAGDADVIRHQKISFSEYRRALSEAGFRVTEKNILN